MSKFQEHCRAAITEELLSKEAVLNDQKKELHLLEEKLRSDMTIQNEIVRTACNQEIELNTIIQRYNVQVIKHQEGALHIEELQGKLKDYESHLNALEDYQQQLGNWYRQHDAVRAEKEKLIALKQAPPSPIKNNAEILFRENELHKREVELKDKEAKLILKQKRNEANMLQRKLNRKFDDKSDLFEDEVCFPPKYQVNWYNYLIHCIESDNRSAAPFY